MEVTSLEGKISENSVRMMPKMLMVVTHRPYAQKAVKQTNQA